MEFHQALGYTRHEVIPMLTAKEILNELRKWSVEDLREFHKQYLDLIKKAGLETSLDEPDVLKLTQLEDVDEKWQEATGYPWLNEENYQEMVKEAGQGVCVPEFTLEDLLTEITPDNIHEEIRTGKPRGREIW